MPIEPELGPDVELKCRNEGRNARDAGEPLSACAYPAESKAKYRWVSGCTLPSATAPEDVS
jgi:hypothetical protein